MKKVFHIITSIAFFMVFTLVYAPYANASVEMVNRTEKTSSELKYYTFQYTKNMPKITKAQKNEAEKIMKQIQNAKKSKITISGKYADKVNVFIYLESKYFRYTGLDCWTSINSKKVTYSIYVAKAKKTYNKNKKIDKDLENIIKKLDIIKGKTTKYEAIEKIHNYIISTCEYDYSLENGELSDALYEHKAVCEGFANLFQALCRKCGIVCSNVDDNLSSEDGHVWNEVIIGGKKYQFDITWDIGRKTQYYYFLTKEEFINLVHPKQMKVRYERLM